MNTSRLLKTAVLSLIFCFSVSFAENPSTVENLKAESRDGAIELTWDEATDSDGIILEYRVYYGASAEDDYSDEVLTNSSNPTYTVEGLSNGLTYYFAVTALDEEENESSNYSEEVSGTPYSEVIESPSVISASQISANEIEIIMSEPVAVRSRTQSFFVIEKNNPANEITIINADVDGSKVYLTAEEGSFNTGAVYEITATSAVEDLDGNPVSSGMTDTATFTAKSPADFIIADPIIEIDDKDVLDPGEVLPETKPENTMPVVPIIEKPVEIHSAAEKDVLPPQDVTDLLMDSSRIKKESIAVLNWKTAVDTDADIIDQVLYTKEGNANWDDGYSIGKNTITQELSVKSDTNYTIRIVTIDKSGNQSNGEIVTFSTQLSKTGPSAILFFGLALVIGLLVLATKRRA